MLFEQDFLIFEQLLLMIKYLPTFTMKVDLEKYNKIVIPCTDI